MKKILKLLGMMLVVVLLFGCNNTFNGGNDINDDQPEVLHIKDYFPIKENVRYVYEGKGNEYASYEVYIDYTSENKVQQRINNGGTEMAKVYKIKDGKLLVSLSKGEVYYRENLLDTIGDESEVLLMEPIKNGTSWTLKDSRVRTITGTSVDVVTPLGSYKAIEVTTEGESGKTIDYYAKDVGLVKSVFVYDDYEVISSLSKMEEDVALTQRISFFYPNINNDKLYYKNKEIRFKTNDMTRKILSESYKESVSNELGKVFSSNTKINSLYLNEDGIVYIDLNRSFLTEMNAGAGYEGMILQCIANTFGKYYGSQKVILTIDNELYESGHIAMKKGEYIKADYEDAVELR